MQLICNFTLPLVPCTILPHTHIFNRGKHTHTNSSVLNESLCPLLVFLCGVVLLALWLFFLIVSHQLQKIQQRRPDLHPKPVAVLIKKKIKKKKIIFPHCLTLKTQKQTIARWRKTHGLSTRALAGDVEADDLLPNDAVGHAVSVVGNLEFNVRTSQIKDTLLVLP